MIHDANDEIFKYCNTSMGLIIVPMLALQWRSHYSVSLIVMWHDSTRWKCHTHPSTL